MTPKSSLTEHQLSLTEGSGKTLIPDEGELKKNQDADLTNCDAWIEQAEAQIQQAESCIPVQTLYAIHPCPQSPCNAGLSNRKQK
jgi:hypothetical protein